MDLGSARHAVTGVAADAVGLLGKAMFWMLTVWALPGLLIIALVKGEILFAVMGAVFCALGLFAWWISNGVIRRGKVRIILAALGLLGFGAMPLAVLLLPASQRPSNAVVVTVNAVLFALVGVLVVAEAFRTAAKEGR